MPISTFGISIPRGPVVWHFEPFWKAVREFHGYDATSALRQPFLTSSKKQADKRNMMKYFFLDDNIAGDNIALIYHDADLLSLLDIKLSCFHPSSPC